MDNRRLILAILLSLIVWTLWVSYVQPPPEVARPPEAGPALDERGDDPGAADGLGAIGSAESGGDDPLAESIGPEPADSADETAEPAQPDVVAELESRVVIDNPRFRAELTNRGAQLVSFLLKRQVDESGEPLDLVRARGDDPYPFALRSADGGPHPLDDALFVVERSRLDDGVEEIHFRHRSAAGAAEKLLRIQPSGLIDVEIAVDGAPGWSVLFGPGVRNPTAKEMESRLLQRMASYERGGDDETVNPAKQREDVFVPAAGLSWATLEDNYFLTAFIPREGVREVVFRPVRQRLEIDDDASRFVPVVAGTDVDSDDGLAADQELLLLAGEPRMRFVAFFGAKRYSHLTRLPYGLESTVRWGFFGFVAQPLYYGLEWFYKRIPNYGWAIVLMTLVIKLIFFPLTHKSQKSMAKMQEISPKIQALRNKYRTKLKDKQGRPNPDAQRQMNEEMMAMYKKAGVNPASGCLPVLIQIPVFFAFFRLLSTAVELRNAPWHLWVRDLSVPDPYFLLPLGMLVTSVLLQRMTPPPPDPMQRRMMQMFPIMFGLFAITFPAGLVLYWMTNNVLTMGQQAIYLRSKKKKAAAES